MRKGISLSMTYVVLGLILLSTAITILLYFTGNVQSLEDVISGKEEASQRQLAQESCLTQKRRLCQQEAYKTATEEENKWYSDAMYKGEPCKKYWKNSDPPGC